MTAEEQLNYLREQALPKLGEGGLECFAIIGYMRLEDGTLQRVCLANTGNDPMFEDALRPILHFAHVWGGQMPSNLPPPTIE